MAYKGKADKGKTVIFWERNNDTNRLSKYEIPESRCKTPEKNRVKKWKEDFKNGRLFSSFGPHTPIAPMKGKKETLGSSGWRHEPK